MMTKLIEDIYGSRNILKALVLKNLIGRYKNSALGIIWHFVTPAILMIIYYLVFTQIRLNPIPDFWVYLASGLFPFNFLTSNFTAGSGYIVNNASFVKKMYFPREVIVLSHVISSFIITLVGVTATLFAIVITGHVISFNVVLIPVVLLLMLIFVIGLTLILSSVTVYVRDIQYLLNTASIALFFITPMYFLSSDATGMLETVIWMNPFTYFVESFHQILYYNSCPSFNIIVGMLLISFLSIIIGIIVFGVLKKGFAERL